MIVTVQDAQAKLDALAKPQRSLGHLEAIAVQLAVVAQSLTPEIRPRRMVIFAGDHGVVAQGVTPWPSDVTTAMAVTILAGRASSNALAKAHGVDVRLVNCGMITPPPLPWPDHYRSAPVDAGTADLSIGPAMSEAQFDAAWALGADEADAAMDAGFRLLIAGEMGIGNTTPSACITHALTNIDATIATGRGAGADVAMQAHKTIIVAEAVARLKGARNKAALAAIAGFEIAAMAGFYAQGAARGALLLIDGYVTTAAALIAETLRPGTKARMISGHRSAEPGHEAGLTHLGLDPLLDWQMRLGEGTGALTALPLLDGASAVLCDVATLDEVLATVTP